MAQSRIAKLMIAEAALADVRNLITGDRSPELRAVRVKLEKYERALRAFRSRAPDPAEEQYRSLHECVLELHQEVFCKPAGVASAEAHEGMAPEPKPSKRPTAKPPRHPAKKGAPGGEFD
jgi:hypothetical protein